MHAWLRPDSIPTVFQFQHTVLRDVGWISDGRTVRIRHDGIGIAARLLVHPLTGRRRVGNQTDEHQQQRLIEAGDFPAVTSGESAGRRRHRNHYPLTYFFSELTKTWRAHSLTSHEWNAAEYHRLSAPQFQWGQRVLSELHLRGDEAVLDAGCGSGKLTALLLQNLPAGRVVGLDLSRNMVRLARQNLRPQFGDRAQFVAADLLHLPFHSCFDGVFRTASFHWILDHEDLFRNLFGALSPGGWLHAQCGGGPNLERLRQRAAVLSQSPEFSPWLAQFREPWFFSDAGGAAHRLREVGFIQVETGLEQAPFAVETGQRFKECLRAFVLHRHLELLPTEALRERFLDALAAACAQDDPPWTLDYWRLNLRARKPR